jgi:protein-S-isoprenylcysteine O-methyltransferase Ste14
MLLGRFWAQRRRKAGALLPQIQSIVKDPTAVIMASSAVVAISMPLIEASLRDFVALRVSSILLGVVFLVVGWMLAYLANKAITRNWSPSIEKTEEQRLVKSGVYAIVRHPLYLSGLLILIGTNIYFGSTWAWLGTILILMVTLYRIPKEERQLEIKFGQEYVVYKQQTKAIIPWVL